VSKRNVLCASANRAYRSYDVNERINYRARSNDNVSDVEIKLAYRGDSHLIAIIQRLYSVETEHLISYNVP